MTRTTIAAIALALATPATAATLDFETGFSGPETHVDGDFGWIKFASPGGLRVVQVGQGPGQSGYGFKSNNTPAVPGSLGGYFMTGSFKGNVRLTMELATPSPIAFDIADIDGDKRREFWGIRAFDATGALLDRQTMLGSKATDGSVTRFSFGGDVALIRIWARTPDGGRNIGWGIDNITTPDIAPIPLPAAVWLMLAGLAALGAARLRG